MTTADELHDGLRHGSDIVRGEVLIRLRAKHPDDHRTVPAIIATLKHDQSQDVRFLAAMQLRHFADERAREALKAAMQSDPAEVVRDEAGWALSFLGASDGDVE